MDSDPPEKQKLTRSAHTHTDTHTHTHTPRHKSTDIHAHTDTSKMRLLWNEVMRLASWRSRRQDFIKKAPCFWSPCLALYLFFTFDLPFRLSSRHSERKLLWCSFRSRIAAIPSGEFKRLLESVTRLGTDLVSWLGKRLWVSPQCWGTIDSSSSGFFGYPKKISWNL